MQYYIMNKYHRTITFRIIISLSLLVGSVHTKAQEEDEESCSQKLVDAQEVFSNGQIELVPGLLNDCLEKGFSRQEKVTAYRLLTLCHLYYNRNIEASETMQKMLRVEPEYRIQDIDPSEFVNLYSTFRTTPVVIIGLKGGIGLTNIYDVSNYHDINSISDTGKYVTDIIMSFGISAEVPILPSLSFVGDILYFRHSYLFEKTVLDYARMEYNESLSGIEVPLLAQWNILKDQKVTPYINAGGSLQVLLKATSEISRIDTYLEDKSRNEESFNKIDLTNSRNILNYGITAGAGVRIKDFISNGYLTLDVKYTRYLRNNVENTNRSSNDRLSYSYLYTDNSLKLENFQFFLGYKIPIYNPKQKKSVKKE